MAILSVERAVCRGLPIAAVAWAGLIVAAPSLGSLPNTGAAYLSASAYWLGALVCHQRPGRSFHLADGQLPVCARCTGLYLSAALGIVLAWCRPAPRRAPPFAAWRRRLVLAALPTAVTVVAEWWWPATTSPLARALAAIPLGAVAGALLAESMSFRVRLGSMRADAAERVESGGLVLLALAAWLVPGSGHLWLGRRTKGLIFLVALTAMFAIGLALNGRLFPFEASQPLVFLAATADLAMGLPYFLAWGLNLGQGQVAAVTYEYANAFLIVAGLLNMLVVLDVYDTAVGRK